MIRRVCKQCLRNYRHFHRGAKKPWPDSLYHEGHNRLCLKHRASALANGASLRAPGAYPAWADRAAIKAIYAEALRQRRAGADVQVDHVVPLNGLKVSGLHVHYNLQIIPAEDNRRKSNKYPVTP